MLRFNLSTTGNKILIDIPIVISFSVLSVTRQYLSWEKVGLAACQIARALGGHVIGTAGTEAGESLAVKCGAHKSYNHKQGDYMKNIAVSYLCKDMLC